MSSPQPGSNPLQGGIRDCHHMGYNRIVLFATKVSEMSRPSGKILITFPLEVFQGLPDGKNNDKREFSTEL